MLANLPQNNQNAQPAAAGGQHTTRDKFMHEGKPIFWRLLTLQVVTINIEHITKTPQRSNKLGIRKRTKKAWTAAVNVPVPLALCQILSCPPSNSDSFSDMD